MKFKRFFSIVIIIVLLLAMTPVSIFAASSSLGGPSTVKNGDVISVSFAISGMSNVYGIQATISYSADTLTYQGCSPGASVVVNHAAPTLRFAAEKSDGSTYPSSFTVATMRFTVKGATGSTVSVSAGNVVVSIKDGENYVDQAASGASYSRTVTAPPPPPPPTTPSTPSTPSTPGTPSAPKSTNANLASLAATNAQIIPSFSASTTSYRASVDFAVSSLNISAKAADSGARVSIQNNTLRAGGETDVRVVVTAPAGNTKTYVIKTTRAADPNYVASGNNFITGITIDKGILSPLFHKETTHYVIWLPYESESISVSAAAEDAKATVSVSGGERLVAGADNMVNIVCTGENGLKKEYSIVVKRAMPFGGAAGAVNMVGIEGAMEQFKRIAAAKSGESDDKGQKITADNNVLLDLSNSVSKQVPKAIFEELQKYPDVNLTINVGYAKIVFHGKDIKTNLDKEYYDFAFAFNSEYENTIREQAKDTSGPVYSFAHNDTLPGYATFYLMTNLTPGKQYNIYKYNLKDEKFYLIAQNVTVGAAGMVAYYNDSCSDYILTPNVIEGAIKYDSVSKQGQVAAITGGIGLNLTTALMVGIGLLIGFFIGYFVPRNKAKVKDGAKKNKKQDEKTAAVSEETTAAEDSSASDAVLAEEEVFEADAALATEDDLNDAVADTPNAEDKLTETNVIQEETMTERGGIHEEVDKEFQSLLQEADMAPVSEAESEIYAPVEEELIPDKGDETSQIVQLAEEEEK